MRNRSERCTLHTDTRHVTQTRCRTIAIARCYNTLRAIRYLRNSRMLQVVTQVADMQSAHSFAVEIDCI